MCRNSPFHLTRGALLASLLFVTACDSGTEALTAPEPGPTEIEAGAFTIRSSQVALSGTIMEGTFEASGTIADSGTVHEVLDSAEPLNRLGNIHGMKTLVSEKGTITMEFYIGLHRVDQQTVRASGGFNIVEGSGAYAGLQGGGRIDRELAATALPADLTGVLQGITQ